LTVSSVFFTTIVIFFSVLRHVHAGQSDKRHYEELI
jgi:hypothetical protein